MIFDKFFSSQYCKPIEVTSNNYPVNIYKNNKEYLNATLTPEEMKALQSVTYTNIENQLSELSKDVDFEKMT